ncbi:hypothetical protein SSX86_007743 [Deinandra increscens subsp. villosa]|uniref:Ubiquitin-like protease family profile domain-containing protein n=1 Tax=Deinandra increscens subsp. villosa TaxID=3103831 RepID=A0AAP0DLQ8_9ASTR
MNSKQPEREDKLDSNSKDLVFSDTINQDQRSSPGKIKKNKELMEAESNPTIDSTNGKEKSASKLDSSLEAEAKKTSPFKNLKLNIPSPSKVQQMSPGQKSKKAEQEVKLDSTVAQNTGLQSFGTSTSKDIVLTDPISEEQPSSPGMININKELKEAESNPKIDSRNEKEKAAMKLDSSLDAEEKKTTQVKKLKLKLPRPSKMQQNSPGQSKNKKDLVLGNTVKEDNLEKNVGEKESKKTSTNEEKQESPGQSKKNKESEDVADVEEEKKKDLSEADKVKKDQVGNFLGVKVSQKTSKKIILKLKRPSSTKKPSTSTGKSNKKEEGENLESEVEKLAKDANPTGSMLIKDAKMKKKQESAPKKKAEALKKIVKEKDQKKKEKKVLIEEVETEQNKTENEKKEVAKAENSDDDFQVPKKEPKDKKGTGNVLKGRKKTIPARKITKKEKQPKKKLKKISSPDVEHENEERAYVAYSGDTLQCRTCVGKFVTMLESLSEEQKKAIENIGFGSVLSFSLNMVPTGLGFWLVKNYDAKNNTLNIGTEKISVTPLEVSEILGVPMGKELVSEKERPRDTTDEVLAEFKGQFTEAIAKRIKLGDVLGIIESQKEGGWVFILNFLVVFNTVFGVTMRNSTVNKRFLSCITEDVDVKNFNWCEYVIRNLKREMQEWKGDDSFCGPVVILAMLLAQKLNEKNNKKKGILGITYINDEVLEELEEEYENSCIKPQREEVEVKKKTEIRKRKNEDQEGDEKKKKLKETKAKNDSNVKLRQERVESKTVGEKKKRVKEETTREGKSKKMKVKDVTEEQDVGEKKIENENDVGEEVFKTEGEEKKKKLKETKPKNDSNVKLSQESVESKTVGEKKKSGKEETTREGKSKKMKVKDVTEEQNVGEKKIVNENDVGEEVFKTPSESGLKKKIQFEVSEENSSVLAFVDQLEQQALSKSKENEEAEVMLSFGFSKMTAHDKDEEEKDDQINDVHISTLIEKSEFLKVDVPTDFEQRLQETEDLNKKESSAEAAILKINENEGRPKRKIVLSDILRSPYVERPVMMKAKITKFESDFSEFIFSASLNHNDIVFATESGEAATRDTFESLCPGVEVHLNVINAWSRVLNYQERFRNKDSPSRLFLSPMMLDPTLYAGKVKNETRLTHFESNMDSILKAEKLKSISGIDIVIIPMLCDEHYYVLCLNLKTKKAELIDNIKKAKKNYKMWPNKMV